MSASLSFLAGYLFCAAVEKPTKPISWVFFALACVFALAAGVLRGV
jgi:hypothetical protein